jgi:tripartite-type tricarboxylate transporter receptor subunit TctC
MNTTRRRLLLAGLALPAVAKEAAAAAPGAAAGGWAPGHPIRFIVPFPAGGATDVVARVLGERMQQRLGQPVVIENRTGSGGNIGMEAAAQAAPDGHTLVMAPWARWRSTSTCTAVSPSTPCAASRRFPWPSAPTTC